MGSLAAQDMVEWCPDLDVALEWHLRSNHFPPLPYGLIPIAKEAIALANKGEWDKEIDMHGYHESPTLPVYLVIGAMHLDAWVKSEEDE